MTSPAWRHRETVQRAQAEIAARRAAEGKDAVVIQAMADDKERFELLLTSLECDCNRISALPQGSARTDLKRDLLKTWLPLIDAYINASKVYQNTALTQVLVWTFDVGLINDALRLAEVAIEQQQPMPERYKRNVKTYVADAFLEWARNEKPNGAIEPYFSEMYAKVMAWAIHDDIKLKYVKLAAVEAKEAEDYEGALALCLQAEKISPRKAQVKTLKAEMTKAIAVQQEAERHNKK